MGYLRTWVAVAVACTVGSTLTGFAPADVDAVNAMEAVQTIQRIAPEAVANAEGATMTTGPGTAVIVGSGDASVVVPNDPAEGIRLGGDETPALTIGLPFAQLASDAAESQLPGVVVYDNKNGSSTVPVIRDDGSVQINTVINDAGAPKRYDYPVGLHAGQALNLNLDGSVTVAGQSGASIAHVAAPWARDATGDDVPTHYEISGNTITQVVDFAVDTVFPVIADPSVIQTTYLYSRADVERMWTTYQTMGTICNLIPGLNYMASLLCPGGARLRDAVNSAHYQKKRLKATFNNCGFTYCNYYDYTVVN